MRNLVILYRGPGAIVPQEPGRTWKRLDIGWHLQSFPTMFDEECADYNRLDLDPTRRKFGSVKVFLCGGRPDNWAKAPTLIHDNYMIMDDDLVPVGCTISDMFNLFEKSGARVAHPALTRESKWAHAISIQPKIWNEPFVPVMQTELMAPMFTREALLDYLPHFSETVSGWGLERLWCQREKERGTPAVRLDATPFNHTRDIGTSYNMAEYCHEANLFLKRHNLGRV